MGVVAKALWVDKLSQELAFEAGATAKRLEETPGYLPVSPRRWVPEGGSEAT